MPIRVEKKNDHHMLKQIYLHSVALERDAHVPMPSGLDPSLRNGEEWTHLANFADQQPAPSDGDKPKKKGLAKFWNIVTGSKSSKNDTSSSKRGRDTQPVERPEDDYPLAPPPPLSYLVNRTSSRERTLSASTSRRVSSPSIVPPPSFSGSAALPTPTSPRQSWFDQDIGDGRKRNGDNKYPGLPSHAEEPFGAYSNGETENGRTVHPATSEPDMRQRIQDMPSFPTTNAPSVPSSPRPMSVLSLYKSLPPLPVEVGEIRPKTMFSLASSPNVNIMPADVDRLSPPQPGFRGPEVRRQSFGGVSTRPDLSNMRTLPMDGRHGDRTAYSGLHPSSYNELGASSRRSFGKLEDSDPKRRSKFGLAALFGKLTGGPHDSNKITNSSSSTFVNDVLSSKPSESDHLGSVTEYGETQTQRSRYGGAPRMSIASRKAIEELVDQDAEFVAYRYPSTDHNLTLLR